MESIGDLDNALMRAILDHSPDAIFARDLEGKHLFANPAFHRVFGLEQTSVIGLTLADLVPVEHAGPLMASDREAIAEARPIRIEHEFVTSAGWRIFEATKYPLRGVDGAIQGVVGISRDITERRRADRLLAQAEAIAQLGSWAWDARTDAIVWSAQQYRLFDLPPDAPPLDFPAFLARVHPDDRAHMEELLQMGMASGKPIAFDFRVVRPDGSVRVLEALGQAELDANGAVRRIIGTDRDITERRHAEQLVREKSAELEDANRRLCEADRRKTELINSVSHDLRTPLTLIMGFSELLEDGSDGPVNEQQREDLRQITFAARRLGSLVDDLLDFARVQAGTFTLDLGPLDLAATVREELAFFTPKLRERQLEARLELDEPLPPVTADGVRVGRALMNLLANAIKFTAPGGTITVTARNLGRAVEVSVRDTGVGIPPEHMARIFERFYQVGEQARVSGGLGLGLSIVASIIQAHGGKLGVESKPGEGSRFWFTLPTLGPQA